MSSIAVRCPFEDCTHYGKIEYVELSRFKRHLAQDHDRADLIQLVLQEGLVLDPLQHHNIGYIIQKIAEYSKVNKS